MMNIQYLSRNIIGVFLLLISVNVHAELYALYNASGN